MRGAGRPCRVPSCAALRPCPVHPDRQAWATKTADRSITGWEWQRRVGRVLARDGGLCRLAMPGCTTIATTADHIVGTAEGGSDDEANLQAACADCNEAKRRDQARAGRKRRQWGR